MRCLLPLTLTVALVTNVQAGTRRLDSASILSEIHNAGAKRVVAKYYDTKAWEQSIMPGIRSAESDWLAAAEQLHKGSDAGASEDLDSALYDALAVAPFRVLPLIQRLYGGTPESLCTMTFEAEIPKGGIAPYLERIEHGLASPRTPQQAEMARLCNRGLTRTRKYAKAHGLK